jgi:hypothetical protein
MDLQQHCSHEVADLLDMAIHNTQPIYSDRCDTEGQMLQVQMLRGTSLLTLHHYVRLARKSYCLRHFRAI